MYSGLVHKQNKISQIFLGGCGVPPKTDNDNRHPSHGHSYRGLPLGWPNKDTKRDAGKMVDFEKELARGECATNLAIVLSL